MKAKIDNCVKKILSESEQRVERLLQQKGPEIRELSKNLYWYDYLDADEMEKIFKGESLKKDKVREWKPSDSNDEGGSGQLVLFHEANR
jgi:hypothetical protein